MTGRHSAQIEGQNVMHSRAHTAGVKTVLLGMDYIDTGMDYIPV